MPSMPGPGSWRTTGTSRSSAPPTRSDARRPADPIVRPDSVWSSTASRAGRRATPSVVPSAGDTSVTLDPVSTRNRAGREPLRTTSTIQTPRASSSGTTVSNAPGLGGRLPVTEGCQRLGPPIVEHGVVGMERDGAAPDPQRFSLVVTLGRRHAEVVEVRRRGHGAEGEPLADQDADGGRDQVSHTDQRGNPRTVGGAEIRSATTPPAGVAAHGRGQGAQIPADTRGRIAAGTARVVPSLERAARLSRSATASPGRDEQYRGVWGAMSGPPMSSINEKAGA